MVDGLLRQVAELAVVDGDVGFAPGESVARRARHLGLDARQHLLHGVEVVGAGGGILLVYFDSFRACQISVSGHFIQIFYRIQQGHGTVFCHDGIDRPGGGKGALQPTGRPVMGMICRPAAFSAPRASSASGVMVPSVVSVSSMSVGMPTIGARLLRGEMAQGLYGDHFGVQGSASSNVTTRCHGWQ